MRLTGPRRGGNPRGASVGRAGRRGADSGAESGAPRARRADRRVGVPGRRAGRNRRPARARRRRDLPGARYGRSRGRGPRSAAPVRPRPRDGRGGDAGASATRCALARMSGVAIRLARVEEIDRVLPLYESLFEPPARALRAGRKSGRRARSRRRSGRPTARSGSRSAMVGLSACALRTSTSTRCASGGDAGLRPGGRPRELTGNRRRAARGGPTLGEGRGATHLELDTAEARTDARRFYERERPSWRSISYGWRLDP